jgi:hypothetical protein
MMIRCSGLKPKMKQNQNQKMIMNRVSALHVADQAKAIRTTQGVTTARAKEKFNMRQHYKINPKPMPQWLETLYDCALAIVLGLLLSGAFFGELMK